MSEMVWLSRTVSRLTFRCPGLDTRIREEAPPPARKTRRFVRPPASAKGPRGPAKRRGPGPFARAAGALARPGPGSRRAPQRGAGRTPTGTGRAQAREKGAR